MFGSVARASWRRTAWTTRSKKRSTGRRAGAAGAGCGSGMVSGIVMTYVEGTRRQERRRYRHGNRDGARARAKFQRSGGLEDCPNVRTNGGQGQFTSLVNSNGGLVRQVALPVLQAVIDCKPLAVTEPGRREPSILVGSAAEERWSRMGLGGSEVGRGRAKDRPGPR